MTENKKPDIRKAEILKAAIKRFNATGYHKTNIDNIAADVGITKAGVYYYFKSKKNLFLEIFRTTVNDYLEKITASITANRDAKENVTQLTIRSAQLLPQNSDILKFCLDFFSMGMRDADIRKEVTRLCNKRIEAARHIIEQGIADGSIKAVDPESASRALFFLSMGFFLVRFCSNIKVDPSSQHVLNMKILFEGLKR